MKRTAIVGAVLAGVLFSNADAWSGRPGDWRVFNHNGRNSRANRAEKTISPENVGRLVPRWRVDALSAVTSTPAVVGRVVYFGDWSGSFHARRTSDGHEIWNRRLGSAIRPSPLVAGDRVYVPESNGVLHALRRDTGDVVWAAPLDTQPLLSIDSSPVLAGRTIVIGVASFEQGIKKADYTFRGSVVGLDARSGQNDGVSTRPRMTRPPGPASPSGLRLPSTRRASSSSSAPGRRTSSRRARAVIP